MTTPIRVHDSSIDFLRLISILAVVMIHTTTRSIEASANNLASFPLTFIFNQLSRFAVPLFFLISGFVLELNYHHYPNYFVYLKKRLSRILIPYLFWSAIYYYFIYTHHSDNFFKSLFYGSASYQLYFIPTLIIFYLIFPILHRIYKYLANKWVIIILGLIQIFILYSDYYLHNISFAYPIVVALFSYFVFILGMIASRSPPSLPRLISIILFLISAIYVVYEGYSRFYQTQNYLSFYSSWRPSLLIYTLLLFVILYNLKPKLSQIKNLSQLSFFVFFIHIIILEIVWSIIGPFYNYALFDLLFFTTVTMLSFGIAFLIHKVPKLIYITG